MRYRLIAVSYWIAGQPNAPYFPPLQADDIRNDITGQSNVPSNPNATVWEIYTNNPAYYDADNNIFIWSTDTIDEPTI